MKKILFQETRNGPLTESQEEEEVLLFCYPICTVINNFRASEMFLSLRGQNKHSLGEDAIRVVGILSGSAERQDRITSDSSPYSVLDVLLLAALKLWIFFSSGGLSSESFREDTRLEGDSL